MTVTRRPWLGLCLVSLVFATVLAGSLSHSEECTTSADGSEQADALLQQTFRRDSNRQAALTEAPPAGDPQEWVARHNYWRCIHGSPPIAWDADFARGAQSWADRGVMEHSDCYNIKPPEGPAGENLAAGSAGYMSIQKAADMWHDENPERGPKCGGHCTAMLWKAAKKLGCGINKQAANGMLLVCRYGGGTPLPNMGGSYEANVGFPDMKKEPECKARHLEGGGGGGAPAPPPPGGAPAPPPPGGAPAPSPSTPAPAGSPMPSSLTDQLKTLKEELQETIEKVDQVQR